MKKWIGILSGTVLLVFQTISLYLIFDVNSKVSLNTTPLSQETVEENNIKVQTYESPVMNLQQAATYIGVTPEQLQGMIDLELKELNRAGSYTGEMIPYFKVDNSMFFYKNQVDIWLEYATIEKIEYNITEGYIFD